MNWDEFSKWGARISGWAKNYHSNIRELPVRSQVKPGEVFNALPANPPESGTGMEEIFADFERIVMPGITHWQHPRFFAYFPANATPPSMLADFLSSTIAANCLLWQASPAGTELETRMMHWLRQSLGLADHFEGVIQDSASSATLAAVLTMRERALNWAGNAQGLAGQKTLRVYCSAEVHTSVDRAIWVAGIGGDNLVRVPISGPLRGMDCDALRQLIADDLAKGYLPIGIIACVGGTGAGATDAIDKVCDIAQEYGVFTHIDAAWAGSAMICPEFREFWPGIDRADSIVFNPHKWLGVQFDCSAHFIRDPDDLVRTLAIRPEYLKTEGQDQIINYSEWSVPLGRRFRSLKIWFVLRSYGLEGLREMIRNHVKWTAEISAKLADTKDFEIITQPFLSLFTFRFVPKNAKNTDALNQQLLDRINDDGRIYLTKTRVDGKLVIRFTAGQFDTTQTDVDMAYDVITEIAAGLIVDFTSQ